MPGRVVPVAGVPWKEGDLIPADTLRRCKVCKQPIEHLAPNRVCCSHPRCQRANRSSRKKREPVSRSAMQEAYELRHADESAALAKKVVSGFAYARKRGADQVTALQWVAKGTGLSVVQVQDILRRSREDSR